VIEILDHREVYHSTLAMNLPRLRELCMSLPGVTEQIQWGKDLVFKVGGKMFCVSCTDLDPSHDVMASFKCDDETFAELVERDGIIPAPYLARAKWVGLRSFDALEDREYQELIPRAHAIVSATLPKKVQAQLASAAPPERGKKTASVRRKRA
jgi:predicted DNA-binding protein (MmcQ/YjbR family)